MGTMRVRRCAHFIPVANDKMLGKGLATAADALVLDLEDAVLPERKDDARGVVAGWLRDVDFGRQERIVRINPLDTPWFRADAEATMVDPPDTYLVPKVHGPDDLRLIDRTLTDLERQHGHPVGSVSLLVLATETPRGLLTIDELARMPRVDALTWGAEDLAAAIGARRNRGADGRYLALFEHARTMTMLAAAAAGVQAFDTAFVDLTDPDGLRADCDYSAAVGFTGKFSIHPSQIDVINDAFTPSAAEIEECRDLLAELEANRREGKLAFRFRGRMVDAPHITQARRVLAAAEALGISTAGTGA
jgi:citrate lyase subunit beta/citryl-CoA lyase